MTHRSRAANNEAEGTMISSETTADRHNLHSRRWMDGHRPRPAATVVASPQGTVEVMQRSRPGVRVTPAGARVARALPGDQAVRDLELDPRHRRRAADP